ncbi:F-box/LRR-repeat/kelch-repeat protein At2g27520-like [Prosopis cineraria]|uniref:F-box/LRR-repeat/kelch-repeat protein At2g27520-like n=1 Tax=Prosopis cineraria TaxID=364024 RepID=UPI0024109132|nr:F-box/LRR-repeat/kelch-repeat protein At2g27520-like [Prosopis cineraria]
MAVGGDNPFLPPEMIIEILKRLPVKSLIRFQSVCKYWKNLFKTPYFIAKHYHYFAHQNPLLIFHAFGCNHRFAPLSLLRYKMDNLEVQRMPAMDSLTLVCGIIGSCNGLLCVLLDYNEYGSPPSLLLLNPVTRETRKVPRTTHDDGSYGVFGWGFGFSPVDKDYRIVRIHNAKFYIYNIQIKFDNFYVGGVEVYSLRTGSWKEVEFGVIKSVRLQSKLVTANGLFFGWDWRVEIIALR